MTRPAFEACAVANGQQGVFARRAFAAGERIGTFEGAIVATPTRLSLQTGAAEHVEPAGNCALRFLNHACNPNAAFTGRELCALCTVPEGSEITIDYTCHEAAMDAPFDCRCGAADCVGRVAGWNALTPAQRATRRTRAASWLPPPDFRNHDRPS